MVIQLRKLIVTIICLSFPISAIAIPSAAVVDAVQAKAAFQREGKQQLLAQGIELYAGDIITTGAKARVVIRLPDTSLVKIGANAHVKFEQLIPPVVSKSEILAAVFNVIKGVFRFTANHNNPLNVKIRVGNSISAGIRGTDVYTHAQADQDIVCLIDGQVSVQAGEVKAMLTQPREGFIVPKGRSPLPISLISEEKFQKWLKNSEISKP
jgi:hypothetical protein